jgi:hypothetical protein
MSILITFIPTDVCESKFCEIFTCPAFGTIDLKFLIQSLTDSFLSPFSIRITAQQCAALGHFAFMILEHAGISKDLAELGLTNISGYKCDKDAHLEFC